MWTKLYDRSYWRSTDGALLHFCGYPGTYQLCLPKKGRVDFLSNYKKFLPIPPEANDCFFMQLALEQAKLAIEAAPNPQVGAVIVKNNKVLSVGFTHKPGQKHAEIDALSRIKKSEDLSESTLYVTLEPCCHYGKTPPCTDAIIESGIKHIVVGTIDPFPKVNGRGIEKLLESNCKVSYSSLEIQCKEQIQEFISRISANTNEILRPNKMDGENEPNVNGQ